MATTPSAICRTAITLLACVVGSAPKSPAQEPSPVDPLPRGVLKKLDGASPGYTLFAPFNVGETYLIDLDGTIVHQWKSRFPPGQTVELLSEGDQKGHLLRCAHDPGASRLRGGGEGGRIEEFDWDGNLVWTFVHCNDEHRQHHDIERLPNGNVLLISWESKTMAEAIEMGRDVEGARQGLWPDCIVEIKPVLPEGGEVVWEWHVWDHLVQDRDPSLPGFGVVAEHPELLDVNAGRPAPSTPAQEMSPEELERLRQLGYVGPEGNHPAPERGDERDGGDRGRDDDAGPRRGRGDRMSADWNHVNSIAWNAELDQLVLSSHNQSEIWIIDHGTTTEEAASHSGGKRGRGGDFLYRWGNPANWRAGRAADQQLFGQHDARWIARGLRGEGHLLVFNNNTGGGMGFGGGGESGRSSQLFELVLPLGADGGYVREGAGPFGPARPVWSYGGKEGEASFFSPIVSGGQRLPNGNTLITSGAEGYVVEVTGKGEVVWEFRNPFGRDLGDPGRGRGPGADAGPGPDPVPGPGGVRRGPPFDGGRGDGRPDGGRFGGGPGARFTGAFYRAIRIAPDDPALAGRKLGGA